MSVIFSFADAEKKIGTWQVEKTVRHLLQERNRSKQEISNLIGKPEGFVSKGLKRKSISLPLLYLLSVHLQTNLFEPLLLLLPEALQGTRREKELQTDIDRLKAELAMMTKERDIYKEMAVGR